jgi:glycosyltransferase involved in cell wall biosynthesis
MMLIIYHDGTKVVEVNNANSSIVAKLDTLKISESLVALAQEYPDTVLAWCHVQLKTQLNISEIETLFHHRKLLFSYNPSNGSFIDRAIGYVEESPFIKISKPVTYPTWQMSSWAGSIHAEVVLAIRNEVTMDQDFDYFLCSLAKRGMSKGLLCYSEPRLLLHRPDPFSTKTSMFRLFRFVKQHYKIQWVFLLFFNLMVYERKVQLMPFFCSLFYKNRGKVNMNLDSIKAESSKKSVDKKTIDVIIPTIGRKDYLHDILLDFAKQTLLPNKIIIVEQNPEAGSTSELDYLTNEKWPFEIQHFFIHQAGACNARNRALEHIVSEWVFLADDDIRVEVDFMQKAMDYINDFGAKAVTLKCLQKGEDQTNATVFQWGTFGSGCSFVCADSLKKCKFKMGYEFGFGEDGDFGMQLRNQGIDVLFLPAPSILHLKAAVGGFRTKPVLRWQNEVVQPKPSPTIMLYQISHNTEEQIRGYKTILFFKYYRHQKIRNPFKYFINFRKQWNQSVFWAKELKSKSTR